MKFDLFFKKIRSKVSVLVAGIMILTCACGCGKPPVTPNVSTGETGTSDTGFVLYGTYDYDSTDTAVLVGIDAEGATLTFQNAMLGKRYTLGYDGTTGFYDRYGQIISLSQLSVGDIVEIRFVKEKRHLTMAALSASAWTKESTDQYIFNGIKNEVTLGNDIYKLSDDLFCYSGKEELDYREINSADVLTFRGIDTTVYSVNVEKGHGYLRLSGHEYFVGGWIEIGTKTILKITEDMLLTVPEGTYNIVVSGSGMSVDRSITIKRGLETVLDLSDVVPETPKEGLVLFSVTPSEATLFIDGEKVDTSAAVSLTYGLHQLMCTCDGYRTLTRYLSVGEENAGISITMEKEPDDVSGNGASTSAQGTDTSAGSQQATTGNSRVYINAPTGAECYVDGNYVGVVPCYFPKTAGSHVVTLSRSGFNTKSYTITVDEGTADMSFSFTDLERTNP